MSIAICKATLRLKLFIMQDELCTHWTGGSHTKPNTSSLHKNSYNLNLSAIGYSTFCYEDMMIGV